MKPAETIDKLIKKLHLSASAELDERVHSEISKVLAESKKIKSAKLEPNIWRIIMKSRITKLAAAAVIIIAVLVIINQFGGSIDGARVAFAQMTENMKEMPWLYSQTTVRYEEDGDEKTYRSECWYSFQSKVMITKGMDGYVDFYDLHSKNKKVYDPGSMTLTVSYMFADEYHLRARKYSELPTELLDKMIESLKSRGAKVEYEKSQYEGTEVDVYYVELPSKKYEKNSYYGVQKFIADREQQILIASETKRWDDRGNITEMFTRYEYPETGPKSIYELGIPKSTKVISLDETPLELDGILETFRSYRDNFLERYIAIVVSSHYQWPFKTYIIESANIFFVDKNRQRMERRNFLLNKPWQEIKKIESEIGDTFESQFEWWSQDTSSQLGIIYGEVDIYDGESFCRLRRQDGQGPWAIQTKTHSFVESPTYADPVHPLKLGWPQSILRSFVVTKISIVENDYSKANNFICIEMLQDGQKHNNKVTRLPRKCLYYINPDGDYICAKTEIIDQLHAPWQSDSSWLDGADLGSIKEDWTLIQEVLKYERTDSGKWYPKKIRRKQIRANRSDEENARNKGRILNIYIKEKPAFPERIFDPENLPKASGK